MTFPVFQDLFGLEMITSFLLVSVSSVVNYHQLDPEGIFFSAQVFCCVVVQIPLTFVGNGIAGLFDMKANFWRLTLSLKFWTRWPIGIGVSCGILIKGNSGHGNGLILSLNSCS